jgi:hypothetical protein
LNYDSQGRYLILNSLPWQWNTSFNGSYALRRFVVGGSDNGGTVTGSFDGSVAIAGVWNRVLTELEIASLTRNPFQLFAPRSRRIFTGSPVLTHKRQRLL